MKGTEPLMQEKEPMTLKKVPARRKLNDDKKLSGNKLNKKQKTVSTNPESPKDVEQLELPTKSKKKRQSIETG